MKTKRNTLIFMAILILAVVSSITAFAVSHKDATDVYKVTFRFKFTSDFEIPEGYGLDGSETSSIVMEYIEGDEITTVPTIRCMGDAVFEGWDKEPLGHKVMEDMTFTATINNEGMISVFFKTVEADGNKAFALSGKTIQDEYFYDCDTVISFVKSGEKMQEGLHIPYAPTRSEGMQVYKARGFEPNPVDLAITEPTEFVCIMDLLNQDEVKTCKITYTAEFTTPIEIPEGYRLLSMNSYEVYEGEMMQEAFIPKIRFIGDGMTFEGWDTEPVGQIITEDTTFIAKFNNDESIVVFFKADDEDGKPVQMLYDPKTYEPGVTPLYRKFIGVYKKGTELTEELVPGINPDINSYGCDWEETPVGYVADETREFTWIYRYYYTVKFIAKPANFVFDVMVHRGEAAEAPKVPEVDGYANFGWDKPFYNITDDLTVTALMFRYGDVNMDEEINTGDAVQILKHCANLSQLTDNALILADANSDKVVNTFDAVKVLRISAGLDRALIF